jgi:hypothetical protein
MNARLASAFFALLVAAANDAAAVPFDTESSDWDGYGAFITLLERAVGPIARVDAVDLAAVEIDDLLVLIEPSDTLPVERIALWVESGGRLLVLDESGGSDPLAERFGLTATDPMTLDRGFLGNDALPRLTPVGRHALSEGIDHIVANHPSALRGAGLPVFATGGDTGVVWDTTLASGRAVFVADPSLFIGLMLPLAGNARLADNIARYLCPPGCTATVVRRGGAVEGAAERPTAGIEDAIERIGESLSELRTIRIDDRALLAAAVLLLTGAFAVILATMPSPRHIRTPEVPQVPARRPRGEFEFGVGRYSGRLREQNFALPAATLADVFESIFYPRLGLGLPGSDAAPEVFDGASIAYVNRWLTSASEGERRRRARALARTLQQVARSPRGEAVFTGAESVDEAAFNALHRELTAILREMGATDEYERRYARPE